MLGRWRESRLPRSVYWPALFPPLEVSTRHIREQEHSCVRWKRVHCRLGYLSLPSHFHVGDRDRIWPSGADWLIVLQARRSIWLVLLMGTTEGTMRISLTWANFASLYQGRKLSIKYCMRSNLHGIKVTIRLRVLTWMLFKEIFDLGIR